MSECGSHGPLVFGMYNIRSSVPVDWHGRNIYDIGLWPWPLLSILTLTFEPSNEIMVLFGLRKMNSSNMHAQPSSWARYLNFGRTLRLLPYFMSAKREGSGETAPMRRLIWAFAVRLCDKYHNLMSWLILLHYWQSVRDTVFIVGRNIFFRPVQNLFTERVIWLWPWPLAGTASFSTDLFFFSLHVKMLWLLEYSWVSAYFALCYSCEEK